MSSNEFQQLLAATNKQIAADAITLYQWVKRHGVFENARKGKVQAGTRDQRLLVSLLAIAEAAFDQALETDERVFDLFDCLVTAWPEKKLNTSDDFLALHAAWRAKNAFNLARVNAIQDLESSRRVRAFVLASE